MLPIYVSQSHSSLSVSPFRPAYNPSPMHPCLLALWCHFMLPKPIHPCLSALCCHFPLPSPTPSCLSALCSQFPLPSPPCCLSALVDSLRFIDPLRPVCQPSAASVRFLVHLLPICQPFAARLRFLLIPVCDLCLCCQFTLPSPSPSYLSALCCQVTLPTHPCL